MFKSILIVLMTSNIWAGEISVQVTALHSAKGDVYIGLYRSAKHFLNTHRTYKSVKLRSKKRLSYRFRGVPAGSYAIAVYHDANSNGELDTNFLGIPNEQTGTSQNAVGRFETPTFDKAKFKHKKHTTLTIRMR
jgi:uncharacterized protein (DUF2141 family)